MPNSTAICLLLNPRAMASAICCSRGVSDSTKIRLDTWVIMAASETLDGPRSRFSRCPRPLHRPGLDGGDDPPGELPGAALVPAPHDHQVVVGRHGDGVAAVAVRREGVGRQSDERLAR